VLALGGYGVGLLGLVGIKILAPGFYATQDIRTPVRIGIAVLVITQLLNLVFVPWLGHAGLALSIGIASLINAGWLMTGLRKAGRYTPLPGWGLFAGRVVLASALLGLLLWFAAHRIHWLDLHAQPLLRVGLMAVCLAAAGGLYFGVLLASGMNLKQAIKR
jgi:putative peptidoglycan lipid II flippase